MRIELSYTRKTRRSVFSAGNLAGHVSPPPLDSGRDVPLRLPMLAIQNPRDGTKARDIPKNPLAPRRFCYDLIEVF